MSNTAKKVVAAVVLWAVVQGAEYIVRRWLE